MKTRDVLFIAALLASAPSKAMAGSFSSGGAAPASTPTFTTPATFNSNITLGDGGSSDSFQINFGSAAIPTAGLVFSTTTDGSGTSILKLSGSNYRVGIGTGTPQYTLDVIGTAGFSDTITTSKGISGSTVTASGAVTANGDVTLGSDTSDVVKTLSIFHALSRTSAQLSVLADTTGPGGIVFCSDCSTPNVYFSTGTGTGAWVSAADGTTPE